MSGRGPRDVGDTVRVYGTFRNLQGIFTDPTALKFRAKNITSGALTEYQYLVNAELVKDSVGSFHVDFTYPSAGAWALRWVATGAISASEQTEELVEADATT